ncbi:MAG: APC family permease, partial [Coriobacteriales bacterium]
YGVIWGLPVLSSDAISSVAYATEEILLVLVPVLGMASYPSMLGAVGLIVALLFLLILCYRQVIDAYPQGGGAYSVASQNLGRVPALIAASGLIIGYVLTIAVSACSGAAAITSAFPSLDPYRVSLVVVFIVLLTIGNLRGLRDSSVLFGLPTYFFIFSILAMLVVGAVKGVAGGQAAVASQSFRQTAQDLTLFLFLRAFSSGCSALTGVEAISNSVPNFSEPAQRKAKLTLAILGLIVLVIFGGVSLLALLYQTVPSANVTLVAQIAAAVFGGRSVMFYVIQVATAIILLLAANTAYNGMPQLMSLLSIDGYLPKRYASKGSRLVYSNGIIFASAFAIILVIVFQAQTHLLIPLYSSGVFLSFTIAQGGMVVHWRHNRRRGWLHKAVINGFGSLVTLVVFVIITVTKFTAGAWVTLVAIGIAAYFMWTVRHHYDNVARALAFDEGQNPRSLLTCGLTHTQVIVLVEQFNKTFIKMLNYARSLSDSIEVYHVKTSAAQARRLKAQYAKLDFDAPLVIEKAPYRNVNEVLVSHIDERLDQLSEHEMLTIVMSQLVTEKWWHYQLHNQTALQLQNSLLERRDVAVVVIPYVIDE